MSGGIAPGQIIESSDILNLPQNLRDGTVFIPGLAFKNDQDTGLYRDQSGFMGVVYAQNLQMSFGPSGPLLTADPTENLGAATKQYVDNAVASSGSGAGIGALTAVPSPATDGAALGTLPTGARGVRLYLPPNASVTFTVASAQPISAPSAVFTTPVSAASGLWDEPLSGQMLYVTAVSGSPMFRWI